MTGTAPAGAPAPAPAPAVTAMFRRVLVLGVILALAIAVVAAVVGALVGGGLGLLSGVIGAATSLIFLGLTAASMLIGARVSKGDLGSPAFYGVVLGTWFVKLIVFFVVAYWLRTQSWVDPAVLFITVIVSVVVFLVLDVVSFFRTRVPYVDPDLRRGPSERGR